MAYNTPGSSVLLHCLPQFAQIHVHWQWCYLTVSFSSTLFFYFQSFSASRSFPMIWLFASGGQILRASTSILPLNIPDWFSLGLSGLISLQSKGLSRVFSSTTDYDCPQTMTQMLSPQIFNQLPHFLPSPFHILFSHPYLWLSLPPSHVPSTLHDRLPTTEPPTISPRYSVHSSQGEGYRLSFISILSIFILFSLSWLTFSMLRFF